MTASPDALTKPTSAVHVSAQAAVLSSADALRSGRKAGFGPTYRGLVKRLLDIVIVLAAAPFVVPVVLALAVLVWLQGGRAFYCQPRVGRGGRIYTMWKLRSMTHNAEAALAAHLEANPQARAEWDATQKLKNDPRITGLGRLLRKSSLDELPQLWNVLKGDMSLVGPRPMMPEQRRLYPGTAYYRLRPGITGPWQVSSRNDSTFAARARFDALYDRTVSLKTDISLLGATVRVVLRGTGH